MRKKYEINYQLFEETTHSPALIDIVDEEIIGEFIDYCFIANPYYPTPEMLEELKSKMTQIIKAYPSSNPRLARENLASVLNINPNFLILGNGATELITIIERTLIRKIAIPVPTFSEYIEKLKTRKAAKLYQLLPDKNFELNIKDYARWIKENKINSALIINPGNPTGQLLNVSEIKWFLNEMSHLDLILLDESFIDFSAVAIPSIIDSVQDYKNLIIVRSMSKHCGVPGLRLGYCCMSNQGFISEITNSLPVWNINSIAEYFLLQLQKTNKEYHESRLHVITDTKDLYDKLIRISGYKVYPTGSNFIFIKIEFEMKARELQQKLLEYFGVYVRDCSNKEGLDEYHIRVSSQGKEKDFYLIEALTQITKEHFITN